VQGTSRLACARQVQSKAGEGLAWVHRQIECTQLQFWGSARANAAWSWRLRLQTQCTFELTALLLKKFHLRLHCYNIVYVTSGTTVKVWRMASRLGHTLPFLPISNIDPLKSSAKADMFTIAFFLKFLVHDVPKTPEASSQPTLVPVPDERTSARIALQKLYVLEKLSFESWSFSFNSLWSEWNIVFALPDPQTCYKMSTCFCLHAGWVHSHSVIPFSEMSPHSRSSSVTAT